MTGYCRNPDFAKAIAVFVEGLDEVNVIEALLREMGRDDVDVRAVGGKDQLSVQLPVAVKQATFSKVRSVGVIQDADDDAGAALNRIRTTLSSARLPVPQNVLEEATNGTVKTRFMLLPGNMEPGYLEDVFLSACSSLAELRCVNQFSACCTAIGGKAFDSKRRAYGVLLALGAPETRLGRAFASGAVDGRSTAYDGLKAFLRAL